jgi:hypothetical protein
VQVYHFGDVLSKERSIYRNHPTSQDHDLGRLTTIISDLFTYDLDQHPFPPPAVKTHVSAIQLTPKIRSQVPKPRKPFRCSNLSSHIVCGRIYLLIDK